jgi:hypothetical protein
MPIRWGLALGGPCSSKGCETASDSGNVGRQEGGNPDGRTAPRLATPIA